MIYFLKFVASFLLPPGIIILSLVMLNIYLYKYKQRGAKALTLLILLFYSISTNYIGNCLLQSLESQYNFPERPEGDVIIMLGGGATLDTPDFEGVGNVSGNAANRLITSTRLQRKLNVPIILSGGQVFEDTGREAIIAKRILQDLGIPEDMIFIDDTSLNTKQNAEHVKRILNEKNFGRPMLVTSAFHMERSVLNFAKIGVAVQPIPVDFITSKRIGFYFNNFVPSLDGLRNTGIAVREWLGILVVKIS